MMPTQMLKQLLRKIQTLTQRQLLRKIQAQLVMQTQKQMLMLMLTLTRIQIPRLIRMLRMTAQEETQAPICFPQNMLTE